MDINNSVIQADNNTSTANLLLAAIILGTHTENAQYWQDSFGYNL